MSRHADETQAIFDPHICKEKLRDIARAQTPTFCMVSHCLNAVSTAKKYSCSLHFQTIHHCSVDVAHGLALLFGIGTKALPLWDSRTRRNNLWVGLAVTPTAGPS